MANPIQKAWWMLDCDRQALSEALEAEGISINGFVNRMPVVENPDDNEQAMEIAKAIKAGTYKKPRRKRRKSKRTSKRRKT